MRQFTERKFLKHKGIPTRGQFFVLDMLNRLKLYLINDCISWPCARRPYVHLCRHGEQHLHYYRSASELLTHLMRKAELVPATWSNTDAHWLYTNRYNSVLIFMAHCCLHVLSLWNGVLSLLTGWRHFICRRAGLSYKCLDTQSSLCMQH